MFLVHYLFLIVIRYLFEVEKKKICVTQMGISKEVPSTTAFEVKRKTKKKTRTKKKGNETKLFLGVE